MRIRTDLHVQSQRGDTLLVLLPPALSSIEAFYEHGFVDAVQRRQLPVDVWLADVTGQHVLEKTVVSALHSSVIQPAQSLGYHSIWLVGISLGAFSALLYAAEHAGQRASRLAGIYLLSPYPGTHDVLAEIRAAGGVVPWSQQQPSTADERSWWHWLARQSTLNIWIMPVHFGTGSEDRFLQGQKLISNLLPSECISVLPGKHNWATWKALWEGWLDRDLVHWLPGSGPLQ